MSLGSKGHALTVLNYTSQYNINDIAIYYVTDLNIFQISRVMGA